MSKPIICLDFDGVIHSYTSGWKGPRNIPDAPVDGAFEFMLQALAEGYDVVVHSSRARYFGGISAMRRWMYRYAGVQQWYESGAGPGFPYMGLESVKFTRWKPSALVTIDDRAIRFDGKFPNPRDAARLVPWNKLPLCETTATPRLPCALRCGTYAGNLGPCETWEEGSNGRCVYCDHGKRCHDYGQGEDKVR